MKCEKAKILCKRANVQFGEEFAVTTLKDQSAFRVDVKIM